MARQLVGTPTLTERLHPPPRLAIESQALLFGLSIAVVGAEVALCKPAAFFYQSWVWPVWVLWLQFIAHGGKTSEGPSASFDGQLDHSHGAGTD